MDLGQGERERKVYVNNLTPTHQKPTQNARVSSQGKRFFECIYDRLIIEERLYLRLPLDAPLVGHPF